MTLQQLQPVLASVLSSRGPINIRKKGAIAINVTGLKDHTLQKHVPHSIAHSINRYIFIIQPLFKNVLHFYRKPRLSAFRKYIQLSCNTNEICTIFSLYASIRHNAYSPFKPESVHQRQWLKYEIQSIGCISTFVLLIETCKMSGHMTLFDKIDFSI